MVANTKLQLCKVLKYIFLKDTLILILSIQNHFNCKTLLSNENQT